LERNVTQSLAASNIRALIEQMLSGDQLVGDEGIQTALLQEEALMDSRLCGNDENDSYMP